MSREALREMVERTKSEWAEGLNCAGRALTAAMRLILVLAMLLLLSIARVLGVLDEQLQPKNDALEAGKVG
jgi:hypothetical protein